ncbi:MAG: flavodoxin family protein [Pontixanthobacter sp.]
MTHSEAPLLIVWHGRTGTSEALAKAAFDAAGQGGSGQTVLCKRAEDVAADDLLGAAAYLFVCPENLAAMSGMMKEMFDRTYYAVLGKIEGRGYATMIAAGSDGENAQKQIDRIAKGWRLRRVADPFIHNTKSQTPEEIWAAKDVPDDAIDHARTLGASMAEGLSLGIF